MVKILGSFEDIGEAAAEAGQNIAGQTKKQAANFTQTAAGQITGNQILPNQNQQGTNEQAQAQQKMSDDQAQQFLKDLYGPSTPAQRQDSLMPAANNNQSVAQSQPQNPDPNTVSDALGLPQSDPNAGKTPQEIAEIESLKKQLHGEYYATLTKPKQQEERAAEKIEREEQEKKMEELQQAEEDEKSALPATQKVGTGETVVGVSG